MNGSNPYSSTSSIYKGCRHQRLGLWSLPWTYDCGAGCLLLVVVQGAQQQVTVCCGIVGVTQPTPRRDRLAMACECRSRLEDRVVKQAFVRLSGGNRGFYAILLLGVIRSDDVPGFHDQGRSLRGRLRGTRSGGDGAQQRRLPAARPPGALHDADRGDGCCGRCCPGAAIL